MPYIHSRIIAGKTEEHEYYFSSQYKRKGISKGDKVKPTKAQQKIINSRLAEKRLRIKINTNFCYGDYHLDMGYTRKRGQEYRTKVQMRKDIDKFLRYLREEYKKVDLELKYIHVMEIGDRGARHHHLIINRGVDTKVVQQCWKKSYKENSKIHFTPLDDTGNYAKLASYLIKYTDKTLGTDKALQGKRWNSSQNLEEPIVKKRIVRKKESFSLEPKIKKGYYIDKDSVVVGIHSPEYYGYGFMRYILVKMEGG